MGGSNISCDFMASLRNRRRNHYTSKRAIGLWDELSFHNKGKKICNFLKEEPYFYTFASLYIKNFNDFVSRYSLLSLKSKKPFLAPNHLWLP